jgi:hypothetical protein
MNLSIGPERRVRTRICDCCGGERQVITGFVYQDECTLAAYFAACYPHQGEAWMDVVLGSWGDDSNADHVTFGCRCGPVDGPSSPACTVVAAASMLPASPVLGRKLTREEALAHPWLGHFWEVVDFLLTADRTLHQHVYGGETS